MSDIARPSPASEPLALPPYAAWLRFVLARPAALLLVLSALFGTAMVLINPPMRGPDEQAHFVRIHSYAQGILLPSLEVDGRKGIHLPADLYDDYRFFDAQRAKIWTPGFTFHEVYEEYRERRARAGETDEARAPVFVPYEGTESYTPAAYAPHVVGALIARVLGLDFLASVNLMRFFGLAAFTAAAAYAVAVTPHLKWAFFLVAMLPASLYGRSVLGADGATLSFTMVMVALSLRIALGGAVPPGRPWERSLWMTLCVFAKPPQIVFVALEPMIHKFRELPARWRVIALVTAPGLILAPLWIWAVDAEMAAWRLYASGVVPKEYFSFSYKLGLMLESPLHFPRAMLATLTNEAFGLWRQLVGVLGWLDTHLHTAIYTAISLAFLPTMFERLAADRPTRLRLAAYAAVIATAYVVLVFLILFITWTSPTEPQVRGVQGRYFVGILPLVALMVAALVNRRLPRGVVAGAAILGAVISGAAAVEGIWRVNWGS